MHSGYLAAGEQRMRQLAKIDSAHAEAADEVLRVSDDFGQRNSIQASKWSFEKKYLHDPFSRFNASMAIAYLIREQRLQSVFNKIGEACLDYALSLQPSSSDAHLLKAWYYFERNQVAEALAAANRAIELEPDYAKAWMGLGFFLTKGPRPVEAVPAFSKALELYPGYPQRSSIIGIIQSLQDDA
jgi:tetratricopeptide (TPR) repeat protein